MSTAGYDESADSAHLKESADGSSIIFLFNHRALIFEAETFKLKHNLSKRVHDILGNTILLTKY